MRLPGSLSYPESLSAAAAMAWRERYGETTLSRMQVVGGGAPVLLGIGGFAAVVITKELSQTLINALPH